MGYSPAGINFSYAASQTGKGGNVGNSDGYSFGGLGGKSGALGKYDVVGKALDSGNPYLQQSRANDKAKTDAAAARQSQLDATKPINQTLAGADTDYANSYNTNKNQYLNNASTYAARYNGQLQGLSDQASKQAGDASALYNNTILPTQKSILDDATKQAGYAMSLKDAGDPNNAVQTAYRDLYNKQGQQVRQQGQQDFGVLSALGAQAAGQQFGASGPMTAGMQGQIYAQNQQQAGNAYAAAQQRMYGLQQQGIDTGIAQSNQVYQYGQQAKDRQSGAVGNLENSNSNYVNQQAGFRGEQGGYAGEQFGVNSGYNSDEFNMNQGGADIAKNNAYAQGGRELGMLNSYYGGTQQDIANNLAATGANNAAKGQLIGSAVGAASGYAGARAGAAGAAGGGNQGYTPQSGGGGPAPYQGAADGGAQYNTGYNAGDPYGYSRRTA